MKRPFKSNNFHALRLAFVMEIFARHFHGQLTRLCPRIGKKYRVGEGQSHQLIGEFLLSWNMVQIGCVPQLTGLRRQRRHQFRMRMPQAVDRNPSAEIQKSPIVIAGQPTACARDKRHRRAIIGGQNRRDHRNTFLMRWE